MAQYVLDNLALPNPDLRYLAYGKVPMWYPPLSPIFLAALSRLSGFDLATVSSRIIPFLEALSPISIFFLARNMFDEFSAYVSTIVLALTPTFVFWTGISDPQSLTLFLIPIYVLLWIKHAREPSNKNVLFIGILLALNFLVHLSYFVAVFILLTVTLTIVARRNVGVWLIRDFFFSVIISQILTSPWWLPKNLYWWWIKALVTSSGLYSVTWQVGDFGVVAAFLGTLSIIYLAINTGRVEKGFRRGEMTIILLIWMVPLFIESQNEAILTAINRVDLTWTTVAKPLEGFRFFPFLAQPLAIATGVFLSDVKGKSFFEKFDQKKVEIAFLVVLFISSLGGLYLHYNIDVKFQTSGLTPEEYEAALWFRERSTPDSRIAADYYRAQMFSGVTAGKALDGGMFPLRNTDLPYISVPAQVQDDLYFLYSTEDAEEALTIARRYGVTHIFYSKNMQDYGNLISNYRPASEYGVPVNLEKFNDPQFFKLAYEDSGFSIMIFEVL
jgi:hypothetical protein